MMIQRLRWNALTQIRAVTKKVLISKVDNRETRSCTGGEVTVWARDTMES